MLLQNRNEELSAAWLYREIAENELDPLRRGLFLELADAAEKQAGIWQTKLAESGSTETIASFKPNFRTRLVGSMIKIFGVRQLRFILSAMKVRGMSIYSAMPTSHPAAARLEQRHKGMGNAGNLRAAVFGVNDGLVSNLSLLAGIAGANANHSMIILTGVAGLLAGACSMASGEYVSVRSQREFFEYQMTLEKEELELYPEEEAVELACIYRARGMPKDSAKQLADLVLSDPDKALDILAREELGLNPAEISSPFGAASSSFAAFGIGAFIPLMPFLFSDSHFALYLSFGCTAFALVVIGGVLSLFTNRSAIYSGLRMLLIGAVAAGITFFSGKLLGVALG
ncbi:MAG: VIT1/CCC1 transporter family protein [Gammaproteobacteria bacterium]|nr:VIT1/CCC1 transporter family protein [Gammaproteobacteria bacterium]